MDINTYKLLALISIKMGDVNSLKILLLSTNGVAKSILAKASEYLIKQISELALNLLHHPDVKLTDVDLKAFGRYHKDLSFLADSQKSLKAKGKLLKKLGPKFVKLLITFMLPYVAGIRVAGSGRMAKAVSEEKSPMPMPNERDRSATK